MKRPVAKISNHSRRLAKVGNFREWRNRPLAKVGEGCQPSLRVQSKRTFRDFGRKTVSISVKTFFFLRSPVFGRNKRLNLRFRPKNPSQFRWRPFFFWRSPLGGKSVWIWDLGRKIRLNFACSCLNLPRKLPPLTKSWLRACMERIQVPRFDKISSHPKKSLLSPPPPE